MNTPTGASKSHQSIFSWSISPDELKHQVEQYNTLGITESYRGVAILAVLALLALSVVFTLFGAIPLDSGTVVEWIIYAIALFFVYKGHRWAIILVMLLWTGDKAYQLYEMSTSGQGNAVLAIVWWAILMPYLFKALKIENGRNKLQPASVSTSTESIYCPKCGSREDKDAKFCTNCANNLAFLNLS